MRKHTRVLFLCTHSAARSQMAAGYLRAIAGEHFQVESAGLEPAEVHPLALQVMQEVGIDISGQSSQPVKPLLGGTWHYGITVCDQAQELCPIFPFPARLVHWAIPDPAQATGSPQQRLEMFRRVRDAIRAHLLEWMSDVEREQASAGSQVQGQSAI